MVEAETARRIEDSIYVQRDRRADGGARRVRMTREGVLIARRLSGVAMVISVPVNAYRGVALDVQPAEDGSPRYVLSLTHRDPDLDILLGETQDGGSVAADWRYWAAWLGLPRLAEEDGELRALDRPADEAVAAMARRRSDANVRKRRPRFLARRKAGDPSRTRMVHAEEREIISYE